MELYLVVFKSFLFFCIFVFLDSVLVSVHLKKHTMIRRLEVAPNKWGGVPLTVCVPLGMISFSTWMQADRRQNPEAIVFEVCK